MDLKRQSEQSGFRPDTSSLVKFQYSKKIVATGLLHQLNILPPPPKAVFGGGGGGRRGEDVRC